VPFEADNLLCYANLPQTLLVLVISGNLFVWSERFEVPPIVGQEILYERAQGFPAGEGWGSAMAARRPQDRRGEQNRRATAEVFLEVEDVVGVARLEIMGNVEVGPVPGCRSLARRNNSLGSEDEMGRDLGSKTNQLCLPGSLLRLDIGKDAAWNRSKCTKFNTKICTKRRCLPSFKFFFPPRTSRLQLLEAVGAAGTPDLK
jgi:hypothetical protein